MSSILIEYQYRGPQGARQAFAKVIESSLIAAQVQFDAEMKYKAVVHERILSESDEGLKASLIETWQAPVTISGVVFPGVHTISDFGNPTIQELDEDESVDSMSEDEMVAFARTLVNANVTLLLTVPYTNYKGVTSVRTIRPLEVWRGSTEWHPEIGWMLTAYDTDKGETRSFKIVDFNFDVVGPDDIRKES